MLVLLWLFQVVFLDSFYKAIKTNDIKSSAQKLADNINSATLSDIVADIARNNDMNIFIADLDGNKLQSSESFPDNIILRLSSIDFNTIIEETKANGGTYMTRFERGNFRNEMQSIGRQPFPKSFAMESIIYTKLVNFKDATEAIIMLNANISPVDATVQTIRVQLIFITLIMIILALFLALYISKKISKPIIKINDTAKKLGAGDYTVHFDSSNYKEISELAETLNFATFELSRVDELRKELIANISHDLRTPLTMITGYSEVIRDLPGENTKENVQVVIDEAKRLTSLVNDILDISKLQSGMMNLNSNEYNFSASIRTILERYAKLIEQDGLIIRFEYENDIFVKADELKISQVVYNLVNNAITYAGKDKTVTVRQTQYENKVKLEVIDKGEGIPEEKLKDIWERYYKVDKDHKRAQIGTGLGLSIVKTILEMHKAQFGVKSDVNNGSTFWFELEI
jgi:signal transduction histidine kinase